MACQWSELPKELLHKISRNISTISDYLRFRAVCSSWRSAAGLLDHPRHNFWLLLPHDSSTATRSFFDLITKQVHDIDLPEARDKAICGSSFGWMFMLDSAHSLSLLNPITRAQILLPSTSRFANNNSKFFSPSCAWDASLSSNPSDPSGDDCIVMVTPGSAQFLAVCRLGDAAWATLDTGLSGFMCSFLCHKGRIYAVNKQGTCAVLDIGTGFRLALIPSPVQASSSIFHASPSYLRFYMSAKSPEELVLVADYWKTKESETDTRDWRTWGCLSVEEEFVEIFRLNPNRELAWSRIESVGDCALFLTERRTSVVCVRASGFPGVVQDCIYFDSPHLSHWDFREDRVHFMSVFKIMENEFDLLSCLREKPQGTCQKVATWVTPTLC